MQESKIVIDLVRFRVDAECSSHNRQFRVPGLEHDASGLIDRERGHTSGEPLRPTKPTTKEPKRRSRPKQQLYKADLQ